MPVLETLLSSVIRNSLILQFFNAISPQNHRLLAEVPSCLLGESYFGGVIFKFVATGDFEVSF